MSQYPDKIFLDRIKSDLLYKNYAFNVLDFNKFYNPYTDALESEKYNLRKHEKYYYGKKLFLNESMSHEQEYFEYKLNENLFRCKNFSEFDKDRFNLLVLGCSITAGVGLPENLIWFNNVLDKLGLDKKSVDVYNLSINGSGISNLIRNAHAFIKTVGKPDLVLMLLPQASRGLIWNKDLDHFENVHYEPNNLNLNSDEEKNKINHVNEFRKYYMGIYSHEDALIQRSMEINLFESLCKSYEINLLWTTWNAFEKDVYQEMKFKNFFYYECSHSDNSAMCNDFHKLWFPEDKSYLHKREKKVKEMNRHNVNNEPYWDIARDGQHPGGYYHNKIAQIFVNEIKKRKML
jgi:hypothetical protein